MYAQLAENLRAQITSGRIRAGQPIPSERSLMQEHGLGRHTVRKAIAILRSEGLVTHLTGMGMIVRERAERQVLTPPAGATVLTRMPSSQERDDLDLDDGVPVFVVISPAGGEEVFPGDQFELRMPQ